MDWGILKSTLDLTRQHIAQDFLIKLVKSQNVLVRKKCDPRLHLESLRLFAKPLVRLAMMMEYFLRHPLQRRHAICRRLQTVFRSWDSFPRNITTTTTLSQQDIPVGAFFWARRLARAWLI
jgi:hypothetical protein